MQSIASIIIMDAVNNLPNNGDCASAGFVVPRSWRVGSYNPTNGGLLPTTLGAPLTDPWGTDYGYCVWEVGVASKSAACDTTNGADQSCTGINGGNSCSGGTGSGYNAARLLGSPTPTTGNANTQYVFAIISAGPNRTFNSTCTAYNGASSTNPLITAGGDDIILSYTYTQASTATSSLWTLNPASLGTAIIDKNLAVGPTLTPTFSVNAANGNLTDTNGLISALGITATGSIITTGGAIGLAQESWVGGINTPICNASNLVGDMYYNTTADAVEVCNCTGGSCPASGSYAWATLDSSTGGAALNTISAATGTASITSPGADTIVWDWSGLSAATAFTFGEITTAATGASGIVNIATMAASTAVPLTITNLGASTYGINITAGGLAFNGTVVLTYPYYSASAQDATSLAIGSSALVSQTANSEKNDALGYDAGEYITSGFDNVAIGYGAMQGVSGTPLTGSYNTAVGFEALKTIQGTGNANSAFGFEALVYNTVGYSNVAVGYQALLHNISGQYNTAIGTAALDAATVGTANNAFGDGALYSITSGNENTAIGGAAGLAALQSLTTGSSNVAVGAGGGAANNGPLGSVTTGSDNTVVGAAALQSLLSGSNNTAVGFSALYSATGSPNDALGYNAGQYITSGASNVAIGYAAMQGTSGNGLTGAYNTAVGNSALAALQTTAASNTALGYQAGDAGTAITTGSSDTFIGYQAQASANNLTNATAIGANAVVGASNSLVLGSGAKVGIGTIAPSNPLSVWPVQYSTGTASQTTTAVVGSGTTWTAAMVGSEFVYVNGINSGLITAVTDATDLTVTTSQTVASQAYTINYPGLNVTSTGKVDIGTTANSAGGAILNVNGTGEFNGILIGPGNPGNGGSVAIGGYNVFGKPLGSATYDYQSVAVGFQALASQVLTSAQNGGYGANVAIGYAAMSSTTAATDNVAIGDGALAGTAGVTGGASNTAVGEGAGLVFSNGTNNTFIGQGTGEKVTSGTSNVFLGSFAAFNTFTTGNNNILIGGGKYAYAVDTPATNTSNFMDIGNILFATGINGTLTAPAGNVGIGTIAPANRLSVSPVQYATGTASQTTTAVVGVGTTWTSAMVGSQLIYANGVSSGTITAVTDATDLTVTTSQTVASQAYTINYPGLNVTSTGNVGIGTTAPAALLNLAGNISAAAWTTTGIDFATNAATYTDTGASTSYATRAVNSYGQPTLASTNAVTLTNGTNLYIAGGAVVGTNTTLSSSYAEYIDSGAVGAATSSYGLAVKAQSGATNNYTAIFTGGNVGIGNTAPGALLDVGTQSTTEGVITLENGSGNTSTSIQPKSGVAGPALGTWTLTLPGKAAGTAGLFLSSDTSGNTSWNSVQGTLSWDAGGLTYEISGSSLAPAKMTNAGHFTQLDCTATQGPVPSSCTTAPQFNVENLTTSTLGSAPTTTLGIVVGTRVVVGQTLTFAVGDEVAIYPSTAPTSCMGIWHCTATYTQP
jgi:hypothetical protein